MFYITSVSHRIAFIFQIGSASIPGSDPRVHAMGGGGGVKCILILLASAIQTSYTVLRQLLL